MLPARSGCSAFGSFRHLWAETRQLLLTRFPFYCINVWFGLLSPLPLASVPLGQPTSAYRIDCRVSVTQTAGESVLCLVSVSSICIFLLSISNCILVFCACFASSASSLRFASAVSGFSFPFLCPSPLWHTLRNVLMCFLCYKWVNFYDLMFVRRRHRTILITVRHFSHTDCGPNTTLSVSLCVFVCVYCVWPKRIHKFASSRLLNYL